MIAKLLKATEEQKVLDATWNLKDLTFEDITQNSNHLHLYLNNLEIFLRVAPLIKKERPPNAAELKSQIS